ncbi:transcriptional regulator [Rhizobium leguminosarum bv. trifolii WSM2297]|uniref:Transcriptional regulator n=1 Tax=Rhizobium leguminosarum bv. trifolii WSM2297 TaxID=754762 RepID=J0CN85_RHILT|nr:GntR family transcriptional regulator [Rhizobium leguminosarum]EJC81070.1 transcriptional regulator [Rhizobium leguminosarum bv. trifolii WSM2297]
MGAESLRLEQPKSLTAMVADRLRVAIIDGEFSLGENISEERLVEAFGVSRSPIRDALNALQFTGLVEVLPKRGSFVFSPSEEAVIMLCDYRFVLEREAALMSFKRAPDALARRMEEVIGRMADALDRGNLRAFGHADTAYHNTFFDLCGNDLIRDAHQLADARIATLRTLLTAPFDDRRRSSFDQHKLMADQLLKGDHDAFTASLKIHVDWRGRLPDAILSQSGKRSR